MAFQFHKIRGFGGLANRRDFRDIGNGLSKAQNISLDIGGKIRTIGGLADFTKVDGATALTQTAKLCPGASLFTYGSDHWRGTDTVVDLLAADNAASDEGGEVNAVGSWVEAGPTGTVTESSVADTDGGAIASNGTSYIIKMVCDNTVLRYFYQTITTVIGQQYLLSADLYSKDLTALSLSVGISTLGTDYGHSAIWSGDVGSWHNFVHRFVATTTTTYVSITVSGTVGEIGYFDDVYVTAIARRDLDTNWLVLVDAPNAQVDLYDVNSDSFSAGLLDFGTVSSYVATIDTINFPTTKTITDSTSQFLNKGIQAGDIRIISGCTSQTANNIMFVVEHVNAGTIRARGNPFTVAADEDGTVTLTKYNPVAFHYVNEALRASPANGGIALRPKHYSFANRTHFEGAEASERKFANWYANDVGPVAPTDVEATTGNGDGAATNLTAGAGFEIGITRTADDGDWIAGTYIIACAFRYDDGQVSALFVPSTDEEFGTAILDSDSLTLTVRGKNDYDERISGGYIFCRKDESDDAWILLAEISMAEGARATLLGTYNAWAESSTADVVYTANFKSLHPNTDSYESISGIDPTTKVEVFTGDNAFWNTSVIARNRCFIGSVRYTAEGGALSHFRDTILYSQVNAYDTFPIGNYVDVIKGDAEDYVKLDVYGNVILAFKERTLYLIDISDPDPAGWGMVQDANKGKYPRRGIRHPGAYFETPVGPAWCNEFGVFLYNGSEIVPLLGDKIELSEHPLAYQRYMEFDGTDDYVTKSNDADLNFGANTDFSIEVLFKTSVVGADYLVMKGSIAGVSKRYLLLIRSDGVLRFNINDATTEVNVEAASIITDGEWKHGVITVDRDGDGQIYVDGSVDGSAVSVAAVGDIDDATKPLAIGIRADNLSLNPFDGAIALVRIWNRALTAAEVLALYNGQPVLAADQGASQTALITGDDSDMDTAGNWVAEGAATVTGGYDSGDAGHDKTLRIQAGDASYERAGLDDQFTLTAGKKYRLRFDYKHIETTDLSETGVRIGDGGAGLQILEGVTLSGTWAIYEDEFTAEYAHVDLEVFCQELEAANGHADNEMLIDNVTLVQIGCVAQYEPKGIGDATWVDQSSNSLDGTVVGATAIFEDSWAKFYTDYSILGYHARTNQLIIMRDCTGKWSSGQDYGDVVIIDLDTGAITTGRRVFTKGVVYSNWATDWRQDLIIAEQTSSTSVTIKRWTDAPQSQAVGLIDIRTADIDFGNPAYAKIFDALVAYYKSSAAQTTPFSYALDGDDRHVAWTRLTGSFAAEQFWEKLTLEPTAFECDTIRFKLDNPTNASIMELNDLTLRFQTKEEDID